MVIAWQLVWKIRKKVFKIIIYYQIITATSGINNTHGNGTVGGDNCYAEKKYFAISKGFCVTTIHKSNELKSDYFSHMGRKNI
jgi:hypothetical protein